jgi:hypothetical protein
MLKKGALRGALFVFWVDIYFTLRRRSEPLVPSSPRADNDAMPGVHLNGWQQLWMVAAVLGFAVVSVVMWMSLPRPPAPAPTEFTRLVELEPSADPYLDAAGEPLKKTPAGQLLSTDPGRAC